MGAFMGMAGLQGMLRRTLYVDGEYNTLMILAAISGAFILIAFLAFFYNIVMSVGIKGVIGIFTRSSLDNKKLLPESA
jgi:cytochrome c oxidase subunit 1